MADSVSVEHGGVTVTTNTASEADLRAEMEAPVAAPPEAAEGRTGPPEAAPEAPAAAPAPGRDEKGRFAKTEVATPPVEVPEPAPDAEPPARRRDDTLPKHDPIARMKQALAQKAEADRRAAALEAELARITRAGAVTANGVTVPVTPPVAKPNSHPEPQFEQFAQEADPYTAYVQAWTRWNTAETVAQSIAQARTEWEDGQTAKAKEEAFQRSLVTGRTTYPDFDTVLTEADTLGLQVSAVMQDAIAESPRAADLVYFLATHPEECIQLAEESRQTPVSAATVMRRFLESRLSPRVPAPSDGTGTGVRASVSTAKPPVTPVGSSPVVSDAPPGESASAAEHARYWNRKLKVPGTR